MADWDLKTLLEGIPCKILGENQTVRRLISDSRKVLPGDCFFDLAEEVNLSRIYTQNAYENGAGIIVSEQKSFLIEVPGKIWVQVPDKWQALTHCARRFFAFKQEHLPLVGITGTCGKTTTALILQHLLHTTEDPVAYIGSLHYNLGGHILPALNTTPDSLTLISLLAQAQHNRCSSGILEVSSHGIARKRIYSLEFATAAFLNLSAEHLDFHKNIDDYFQVKTQLFNPQRVGVMVVNADDSYGQKLLKKWPKSSSLIRFGNASQADVFAAKMKTSFKGTEFELNVFGRKFPVRTKLLGYFNLQNILAAISLGLAFNKPIEQLLAQLETFLGIPGRVEKIEEGQPFSVYVDYSHKIGALEAILSFFREELLKKNSDRLLLVFGCGGNKDRLKRPIMASIAERYADQIWVTDDNPRTESQQQIFEDIRKGFKNLSNISFVTDRKVAIQEAVAAAKENDVLILAGRGCQSELILDGFTIPFDDRNVVRAILQKCKK